MSVCLKCKLSLNNLNYSYWYYWHHVFLIDRIISFHGSIIFYSRLSFRLNIYSRVPVPVHNFYESIRETFFFFKYKIYYGKQKKQIKRNDQDCMYAHTHVRTYVYSSIWIFLIILRKHDFRVTYGTCTGTGTGT